MSLPACTMALGANAKSFFAQLLEDPTHHILNEPALGGYQLLLLKIKGTQALIHYIERSTTQLVEYKALNLMDVGSSSMVEITSYDVIINESYTKSQLSNILLDGPWGLHVAAQVYMIIFTKSLLIIA